jgi:hypothetical protein
LEKFRIEENAGGGKFRVTCRDIKKGHGAVSESSRDHDESGLTQSGEKEIALNSSYQTTRCHNPDHYEECLTVTGVTG